MAMTCPGTDSIWDRNGACCMPVKVNQVIYPVTNRNRIRNSRESRSVILFFKRKPPSDVVIMIA